MVIHIVTSYKGGIGKTTLILSIANHCIKEGKKFILVDTNPQNSNIAEDIFFYFHVDHAIRGDDVIKNGVVYTFSPSSESTFTVLNATDSNPFDVVRHIQQTYTDNEHVYVIDTNVHIRSFDMSEIKGEHDVFVWFLWGWSSPRLDHQLQSILDATARVEKHLPKSQVIHVFNLYDFYSSGLKLFGLRKASTTLRPLKSVLKLLDKKIKSFKKKRCKAVYVDVKLMNNVMKDLHEELVRYEVSDNMTLEELPILWASHLTALISSKKRKYPYNILLIPTFFRELTLSIDRIVMAAPRSFEKITHLIKPMATFIDVFLYNLDRCISKT